LAHVFEDRQLWDALQKAANAAESRERILNRLWQENLILFAKRPSPDRSTSSDWWLTG